ncbi:MAG TPA: hypothetical protein VGR43_05715 [Dehalococcoidia bacterium]|nr:hypothetical protein [Dehalococcoidia bacterium]
MTSAAPAKEPKARRLHPLHHPRQITVEAGEGGEPMALNLSGRRIAVESIVESWRIDDEWWREKSISRLYRRVLLEDGRVVDVYEDLVSGKWWRQAY